MMWQAPPVWFCQMSSVRSCEASPVKFRQVISLKHCHVAGYVVSPIRFCQVHCQTQSSVLLRQVVSRVPGQVMSSVLCHVVKCCLSSSGKCPLLSSFKRRKKLCRVLCQVGQSVFPLGCIKCSPSGSVKSSVSFVKNGRAACFPTFKTQHNLITSLKTPHWLQ